MKKILIIVSILLLILSISVLLIQKTQQPKIVKIGQIPKAYSVQKPSDLKLKTRQVKKKDQILSVISNKTVYLTFDDGPSYLTEDILNILEKEQVPATFFVVGVHINEYKNVVKRAYEQGHTIALHSDTHNYQYIYSKDENYFQDLQTINNKVYDILGHHSRIVRLPGGSSNTVSKKYNEKIITRITDRLKEKDYYYYDWNIDSGDASGKLSKEQIYQNVVSHLHEGNNIILMHDTSVKQTTRDALSDIIKYAKENEYTFAKITKDTPPIRHRISN